MSGERHLVRGSSGRFFDVQAWGYSPDFGPGLISGASFVGSLRIQRRRFLEDYYRNRQHDRHTHTWGGKLLPGFAPGHQPLLKTANVDYWVPLEERRPCSPYRLPRKIVRSFTSLLFGEGRFPEVRVTGDPETQDFLRALVDLAKLPERFEHARNVGGSSGTVGISWRFWNGKPRVQVHPGSTIDVLEWEDREELIPRVVVSIVRVDREVYDEKEKGMVNKPHWWRHDWTPAGDIVYVEQPEDARDKDWIVDEEASALHGEGFCHFIWIQNAPSYDGSDIDGEADYEGHEEACDALDMSFSATTYGGAKNLDPTLLLGVEPTKLRAMMGRGELQKGSDNAIALGASEASATKYLEISGASISAGISLIDRQRSAIFETVNVVSPDADKVAAAGTSGAALRLLYAPMLAPAAGLRTRYGEAIVELLKQWEKSIRMRAGEDGVLRPLPSGEEEEETSEATEDRSSVDGESVGEPEAEGEEAAIEEVEAEPPEELFLDVPPRVEEQAVIDPSTGLPTKEKTVVSVERRLGKGGDVQLHWGDWFEATPDDDQKFVATLSQAAGGKPVVSQKSAVERAAARFNLDPEEEWREVSAQNQAEREVNQGMFPPAGGAPPPPQLPAWDSNEPTEDRSSVGEDGSAEPTT